jgi:DNA-binding SARP family transcriptional activator
MSDNVTSFRILGPLGIRRAGRNLVIGARRQRAVLAMLLLSPGRLVSLDGLIQAVWPDGPPATGRTQVAICVTALRKLFRDTGSDAVIVTGPRGYLLPHGPHRIDAVDFAERVAAGRSAVRQGRPAAAIRGFTEALALWHGPALPGLRGGPIENAVATLEAERLAVYEELAAVRLAVGEHDTVAGELSMLVKEYPTRQTARAHLMLAQYRSGHPQDALATFADGERHAQDGGQELGSALLDLHEAIRNDSQPRIADPVPAQLPADVPSFTGRACELSVLDHVIDERAGLPGVGLITGGPGVGKTGLAVHWAHRVAARFPHGQLFADLHGHDGTEPVDPATVLDGMLRALGVRADHVPAGPAERAALYRSLLDRRRVLVVLDGARSFQQIAPLIPGGAGCCVLVTSRAQLGALIDRHGAARLRLGRLDTPEATELLDRMVADARVAAEPGCTARLAELCDRLPLALRIAAARLVAKPHWTIAHLVARLADPAHRLDELAAGEQDVRTGILASYADLAPAEAALLRGLAAIEPDGFGVPLAATVAGTARDHAEALLERLVDAHLVDVVGRDHLGGVRYRLALLPQLFARERAAECPGRPAG